VCAALFFLGAAPAAAVHLQTIAELMACREREAWRTRVTEAQGEMFALLGTGY